MSTTVLLANLPRMLEHMIASVLQPHPDIRVVRCESDGDLLSAATAAQANVVIVARRDPTSLDDIDPRFAQAASVSVFAIAPDGASACMHVLRPETTRFVDVSAEEILDALVTSRHEQHKGGRQ